MTKNSKVIGVLILILVAASFLRLYSLNSYPPGLYSDEAMNGNNAAEALESDDFKIFYTENNGREGLFMNIQALFLRFSGVNEPWVLRLPSTLFGILTVLGVYLLTKELFGRNDVALLAAFLIATSFWHINFSRIGFRAIMAPAFLTWGLYLLLCSFRNSKLEIRNWPLPALAGLVYGLGMHSYIAYRATPLFIAFSLWLLAFRHGSKQTLKIGAIFTAAAVIVFLPLGFYFLENPADFFGRTSQISVWQSSAPFKDLGLNILKTAGMFNIAGDWNPRHNIPGAPLLWLPVGILFLVGLAISIKQIKSLPSKIILGWIIVAALPVVVSNEGMPHALRAIIMAPAVFILAALGGVWFYDRVKTVSRAKFINIISFIVIAFIAANAYTSYFLDWTKRPEVADAFNQKYVRIAEELNALPPELPKYVVLATGGHDVREIGTPAQTIMYLTDTFLPEKQKEKNLFYISPTEAQSVPQNSVIFNL
ncbi:MAG: glycosyltransferase family 39 protein [Candidatus Brennerbacteria bacterium]|nr:glycosyltransferase family 39 protein [Candidatus Brennerbacteria bacterium]